MSVVQSNASRTAIKALVVASPSLRAAIVATLASQQIASSESDDPYHAMTELCRKPLHYRAIVLSLQSLYREELAVVASIKRTCRQVEVWLCDIDGRSSALAEAMRLGADGLLTEDGVHRLGADRSIQASPANDEREQRTPEYIKPPETLRTSTGNGRPVDSPVVPILRTTPAPASVEEQPVATASVRRGERPARTPIWTDSRPALAAEPATSPVSPVSSQPRVDEHPSPDEPVLTADELRALLSDQGSA